MWVRGMGRSVVGGQSGGWWERWIVGGVGIGYGFEFGWGERGREGER